MVFIVYFNSLHGEFVFDDRAVVLANPQLLNVKTVADVFHFSDWREPLYITYRLNYLLSGLSTTSYHLLSVALHALNVILVFYILLEIGASRWASLAGASLFAVHPLFSASVSYIAGRSSLLCGTFYFLSVLIFLKALGSSNTFARVGLFGLGVIAAWLGWETKQEAITLPGFLAAYFWIHSHEKKWRYIAILSAIPIATVFLVRRQLAELLGTVAQNQDLVRAGYDPTLPFPVYVRTYLAALVGRVFPKFIWPSGLNVDPDVPAVANWYSPEFVFALLVIAGLVGAVLLLNGRDRLLLRLGLAGILCSPLFAYAAAPIADIIQEHRLYIAGLGFALIAAWLVEWSLKNYQSVSTWIVGLAVVVLAVVTINRNTAWASDIALWEDAVQKSPQKARTHMNLGQAYQRNERLTDARRQYEIAAELAPGLIHADLNLGLLYLQQNDLEHAHPLFERLRQKDPDFPDAYSNLGIVYVRLNQPDRALEVLNRALQLKPGWDAALFPRGDAYTLKGDYEHAIADYKAAIAARPDVGLFRLRLGATYKRAGNLQAAEEIFRGLMQDPKYSAAANRNLGLLRSDAGDDEGAIAFFQTALVQQPNLPEVHHDLGLVYLHKGMPDPAISEFQVALTQAPEFELAAVGLSQAYEKAGKRDQARQVLSDFLQKYPSHDSSELREIFNRLR